MFFFFYIYSDITYSIRKNSYLIKLVSSKLDKTRRTSIRELSWSISWVQLDRTSTRESSLNFCSKSNFTIRLKTSSSTLNVSRASKSSDSRNVLKLLELKSSESKKRKFTKNRLNLWISKRHILNKKARCL
jgi:hypothetical protein